MRNKSDLKDSYNQIVSLYDVAEELISDIKNTPKNLQEAHFKLVNPLVEQIESSADVLTEEFIHLAENESGVPCERSKKAVESHLRKSFEAIEAFFKTAHNNKRQELNGIFSAILPVLTQAKRQLHKAVAAFLHLAHLSLNKIMPKSEVEEMKQQEPIIAELLHKHVQDQQKGRQ